MGTRKGTRTEVVLALLAAVLIASAWARPAPESERVSARASTGDTFYVSSSAGNDAWPGTRPRPWRTLARVSSRSFRPGDRILLNRGDVWTGEELVLSGSIRRMDDPWISVGAYGSGPRPRITNPPSDLTPGLVDWSSINQAIPGTDRQNMKIAVRVAGGSGWKITGLEIDSAEMGIYIPGGSRFWMEDLDIHDILGLFMPEYPGFATACQEASGCPMWDPFPVPAWGAAISVLGDHVTVKDVAIERATGGIDGFANVGLVENVFIDRVTSGGLTLGGNGLTVRSVTVLNAQWPDGAWFGADPIMTDWVSGMVVERSEFAYSDNYSYNSDASPIDIDMESVGIVLRDNFFHDNTGSALEFNLAGENRRIRVVRNVAYRNGLDQDPPPGSDYLKAAFSADACGFYPSPTFTIRGNRVYGAYPDQYLTYSFASGSFSNGFSPAECSYRMSGNRAFEYGQYSLPLPVPSPPPIRQVNVAPLASVEVSSGAGSAWAAQDGSLDTEWVSDEARPWIVYTWKRPQTIDRIRLFDRPDLQNWAVSGRLIFSDGSSVDVTGGILNNGAMREVVLDALKTVTSVEFQVTRTVPESPGTNVGLSDLQVYLAGAPPPAPRPVPPGRASVSFSDRPPGAKPLTGTYPRGPLGIDWGDAEWATLRDPTSGNRFAYVDFARYSPYAPRTRGPIFVLPAGKVLRQLSVSCPRRAVVALAQPGQPAVQAPCTGRPTFVRTGWTAPVLSDVVSLWIDLSRTNADLPDVRFDDLVYGD